MVRAGSPRDHSSLSLCATAKSLRCREAGGNLPKRNVSLSSRVPMCRPRGKEASAKRHHERRRRYPRFENPRRREPAHQRLPHLGRIDPGFRGKQQGLADRLDRERDDDLIGDFRDLAGAGLADQRDVLAHQLEQRLHLVEGFLRTADHDGKARGFRADFTAGHRSTSSS